MLLTERPQKAAGLVRAAVEIGLGEVQVAVSETEDKLPSRVHPEPDLWRLTAVHESREEKVGAVHVRDLRHIGMG